MAKLPDEVKEDLESRLAGLEARLAVLGDRGTEEMRASLQAHIDNVKAALGRKAKGRAEKRPTDSGAEKRPG